MAFSRYSEVLEEFSLEILLDSSIPKKTKRRKFTVNCWRALARQQTILYNSEKEPKIVGCKIVDMCSRLRNVYPGYGRLHYYVKCA